MRNKAKLQKASGTSADSKQTRYQRRKIIALIDDQSSRMTQVATKTSRSLKTPNLKRIPKTEDSA
jgi:hypothetical protein